MLDKSGTALGEFEMSRTVRQVALASCLGAIAVSLAPHAAFASGFALREESADGVATAYAGQAAKAYDASTVYYNPAGMSLLGSSEISSTASWISPDVKFSGQNSNPLYASGVGGPTVNGIDGPNAVKPAAIGSIFGVWKINSDFSAGFSFAIPYGQRAEYKENFVGRYQSLASDITDYEGSLDLSYKIAPNLSIGGGIRGDYFTGRLTQALNVSAIGLDVAQGLGAGAQQYGAGATQAAAGATAAATAAAQAAAAGNTAQAAALGAQAQTYAAQAKAAQAQAVALAAQATTMQSLALGWAANGSDGLGKLQGDDYGYGYTLGAIYEFDEQTRIGFNYKSRIFHDLSGNQQIQLPGNASAAPASFTSLLPAYQNANLKITLPDSANLGLYHEINDEWAVMATIEWTDWSLLKQLNATGTGGTSLSSLDENWRNTWFGSVGANWKPIDRWTFHVGLAYDQAPMTDANRNSRIPDSDRIWTAFGFTYDVTRATQFQFGYAHLFTPGGNVSDSAGASNGGGVLTGSYSDSADIVSATIDMAF
jgi:long-chain fatty acid transport protein